MVGNSTYIKRNRVTESDGVFAAASFILLGSGHSDIQTTLSACTHTKNSTHSVGWPVGQKLKVSARL